MQFLLVSLFAMVTLAQAQNDSLNCRRGNMGCW